MSFVSYAQNFEDVMLWRALKHIQNGMYVDVGAQHPVIDSVSKAFCERGWRGIHIEPVSYYAQLLRQDRPDEVVLEVALSDIEGTMELNVIAETGLSTAVDAYAQRHHIERGFDFQKIQVQVLTLKSALRSLEGKDVHWLKIDVEGFEEKVLKGWDSRTLRPWVMVVEATIPDSPKVDYANWDPILTAADYQFVYFDGLNRFYIAKEHAELAEAFSCPPNVFDDVEVTASSQLCRKLIASHQASEKDLAAKSKRLQNELNVISDKIHELSQSSCHWRAVADQLNQELQSIYASSSWRITKPLRLLSLTVKKITNGILAIPKGLWFAFKFPFKLLLAGLIRFILKHPALEAPALAKLRKYPRLEAHLCRFASLYNIALEEAVFSTRVDQNISAEHVGIYSDLSQLSPRARRIYQGLKAAIEQQQKENS